MRSSPRVDDGKFGLAREEGIQEEPKDRKRCFQ